VTARPQPSRGVTLTLTVLCIAELVSVAILFGNLFTVHYRPITAVIGPVHGAIYLAVVVTGLLGRGLDPLTRFLSVLPIVGGVLAVWRLRRRSPEGLRSY
jgi:ABC-type uncharacterized transport system permease subunit